MAEHQEGHIFLQANRFETEQNAVFLDFSQPEVFRYIENYQTLTIYQRVSLSKNIPAIKEVCQGHPTFFTFITHLASDNEDIKTELIGFMRHEIPLINEQTDVQHLFIEPLIKLISHSHLEIRQEACVLLTQITHKLTGNERKEVIKLALQLERNDDEESKIISINLISKMTPDMAPEEAETFFKNDYLNIFKQSSVRVKRQIIHSAHTIAKNVTKQFLNRQIIDGFLLQKCREPVWGIRKSCLQILPQMVVLTDSRKDQLGNILLYLTKDGNKIVKITAHKIVPQFLANYNSPNPPDKLVNLYIHLLDHSINEMFGSDGELGKKVAFYFPGVMMTLGAGKWQLMEKLFTRLIHHKNIEVKIPIASSLHEISRIIGPTLSKEYMFTALDVILKDSSDSVKLASIRHIAEFVQLFQQSIRENLIDVFLVLQKDPKKWRVRFQIARQLHILSRIYQTETVFKYIFPISLKLCNDNVSQVRLEAALQMFHVIDNMKYSGLYQDMALQSLKGYALSEKCVQRETFAFMIRNLYKIKDFANKLMTLVVDLSKDKIIVVRITLAISISMILEQTPQMSGSFGQTIFNLKQDELDVREYLE